MAWTIVANTDSYPEINRPFEYFAKGGKLSYGVIKTPVANGEHIRIQDGSTHAHYTSSIVCWRYIDLPEEVINSILGHPGIQFSTVYRAR